MSLDHDLQNLPKLSDDDRDALNDAYSVMPALMDDDAALGNRTHALRYATHWPSRSPRFARAVPCSIPLTAN